MTRLSEIKARHEQLRIMANDGYAPAIWAISRIERLEAALKTARAQVLTLGGDPLKNGAFGNAVQLAVLIDIDAALQMEGGE